MSTVRNADVLRKVIEEGFNRTHYEALDALFAAGYAEHQFGLPPNLEGFKDELRQLHAAFPDLNLEIEDLIEKGDWVWVRTTARGTHTGPFLHRPPTGKRFAINVMDCVRIEGGKIVEHWGVADRFALLWQLQLLPRPEPQPA